MDSTNIQYKGLNSEKARELQQQYGLNTLDSKEDSAILRLLKKLTNPITIMIEVALVLSIITQKWEDFSIILALLLVNIFVDFWQEQKAHNALKTLKKNLAPKATVLRDGKFITIDAINLVPNDIIKLVIGDVVPADAVLIDSKTVEVDQSTITGESLPVEKHKGDTLYSSSIIKNGSILAKIIAIGDQTSIGKSGELVRTAEQDEESHFQKAIFNIGKFLIILSLILVIILTFILILRGDPILEIMQFSLILAVASIPVALPAVLSVTMAIGAAKLSKEKAIVSNFKAVEELAGVDILCVDKTGTLTKNELSITNPKNYNEYSIAELFIYAILASEPTHKNELENAIESYAQQNNLLQDLPKYNLEKYVPFNPTRKTTEAHVEKDGEKIRIIMGAPQVLANSLSKEDKTILSENVNTFAKNGFRSLAIITISDNTTNLVGLLPLFDPPRDDSKSVINAMKRFGMQIKMLTGDNSAIAKFIAKLIKIDGDMVTARTMHNKNDDEKLNSEFVNNTDIFAEVIPEDKYNIINALQKEGHIVAMTGDGVNDAPALKKADIGIAVSGATPAARSAADIILLAPGLSAIQTAVEHARMIFNRMQSYATFRIAETIRVIFFITLSVIFFGNAPLTAIMIVLLALLNDIPVMAMAYDNAIVSKKPIRWHMHETLTISTILGIAGLISSFLLLFFLNSIGVALITIQTILFLKLDVSGHSTLYITRTGKKHFWKRPFPSLKFFIPAFGSRIIGTIFALFGIFMQAIDWKIIVFIWIYSTIWFVANDYIKVSTYKVIDMIEKRKLFLKFFAH